MDTLPTELHACICHLACTDDGMNIRALNKVSKYFNAVSKPYLYTNVSAIGPTQIMALVGRLENTPVHLRQVNRLFLADLASPTPEIVSNQTPATRLTEVECFSIIRLISLIAPSLRNFTFLAQSPFSSSSLIGCIFRTRFPHLKHLTISGFYPFPSLPGKFPSLTHLRLDGNRNPVGLFQMSALEDACPELVDLTVSGLGAASGFVLELEETMAGDGSEPHGNEQGECESDSMMPTRLPPKLRRLSVQPGPEPTIASPTASRETASVKDKVMMKQLNDLKMKKVSGSTVQLEVLERCPTPTSLDNLWKDWLRRVEDYE